MRSPGLRVQIVLALTLVMAIAFVPLYFAVASLARVSLLASREESARALARAVAAHVADVRSRDEAAVPRACDAHVGKGGVDAICVYDASGARVSCAGDADEIALIGAPSLPFGESVSTVHGAKGRALDVVVPDSRGAIVTRVRTDENADRSAPLVRLVAGYMGVFAIALAFLAYFALTRLIVRPVEALSRAADKVASGGRNVTMPKSGAAELVELSASVETMTTRLVADEVALRKKVDELVLAQQEIEKAQEQLVRSERLASVGRLSAGLAHEIGNPITAIMGILDLVAAGDLSKEEEADFLRRMKKETERIHRILRDLLDFARPQEARDTGAHEAPRVDVKAACEEVVALAKPQKTFKSVALELEAEEGVFARLGPSKLSQVLLNLVLNAGDALASAKDGHVRVRAKKHGAHVRIEVEDDGPGVSADVRGKIFEPFVTTKEVGKGTGLGLAVCRGIVEASGGTIELDESYADGARFVVVLPAD